MKGIVSKGESLTLTFEVEQVRFNGKYTSVVDLPKDYSKAELVKLRNAGVINSWTEWPDDISVEVKTELIEWED